MKNFIEPKDQTKQCKQQQLSHNIYNGAMLMNNRTPLRLKALSLRLFYNTPKTPEE
jgi:hypothetical protein